MKTKFNNNSKQKKQLSKYEIPDEFSEYRVFQIMQYLNQHSYKVVEKPSYFEGTQDEWEDLTLEIQEQMKDLLSNSGVYANPVLSQHLTMYKRFINDLGNRVHVVGHSQGNLFANLAYDKLLLDNLTDYFNLSATATPANRVAGTMNDETYVKNKSDWVVSSNGLLMIFGDTLPYNNINSKVYDSSLIMPHLFNPSYIAGDNSAPKIFTNIKYQISNLLIKPSKWTVVSEDDSITQKGTKEYRIKIEDKTNVQTQQSDIIPFGLDDFDKIYYTTFINGANKGQSILVKGSCKGDGIIDHTNAQVFDKGKRVLYELINTNQKIYEENKGCKPGNISNPKRSVNSNWLDILIKENENVVWTITGDNGKDPLDYRYRLTAENNQGEVIENIYPFNREQGATIYQLESGKWVMAQCGGKRIVTHWTKPVRRKWNEIYKLEGLHELDENLTDPIIKTKRFVRYDDKNVITDFYKFVQWEDQPTTQYDNQYAAIRYCNRLVLGGHDDWFLPNTKQLISLYNGSNNPHVEAEFQNLGNYPYWSSETQWLGSTHYGTVVDYRAARVNRYIPIKYYNRNRIRCVRIGTY